MKKLIVKIVHKLNPNYFAPKSYAELDFWGIEDIVYGKIYFKDGETYGGNK